MLEHLAAHLAGGGRIEIRDFGSFSLRHHRPRLGRNPRTGAPVARPGGHGEHFKLGGALRSRVDAGRVGNGGEGKQGASGRTPTR